MDDQMDIVLLAAGRATRMRGADKMLEQVPAMLGTEPLIRAMARRCARVGPTRVVIAPGQDARRAALEGVEAEIVEAPEGDGMAASIAAGVHGRTGPVILVLADMPGITAKDIYLLAGLSRQAPDAILRAAAADGRPGHPVLFPADLRPELEALNGDTGARSVLQAHKSRVHLVPLEDDRALIDLDTPEDWADWRAATR
ncbi:nucleotidyltransferase family protein [Roseibacterium beibuensis]|nr:nucleotidyltransferase family protein [Roseibacterium beibuensis]MCS6626759.1 nucleotidyltransferase family protein [Roseibacterium beibuensis]